MSPIRRLAAATIIPACAVLLLLSGCDIFQTRDPQAPTQGTSSITPPTRPEIVLDNFRAAIEQDNADNYVRSFSDTSGSLPAYRFVPSTQAAARYPGVFHDWGVPEERNYFLNLGKPVNGTPRFDTTGTPTISVGTDSVTYTITYTLYYPHSREGVPQFVRGQMQLDMKPDNHGLWYITAWRDYKTTTDSTWSYLKAVFSGS